LPCALEEVRPAMRKVSDFLRDEGLHPEELMACEPAVTEACNNAIQYADGSSSRQPVEVRTFCNGSAVEFQAIATEGMPLGVLAQATFHDSTVPLRPGCRLLLYTDGVTDACNSHEEHFGQERLASWLLQSATRLATAPALKDELASALAQFESQTESRDDQTFLILAEEQ
jgi:serine/threonine protein phosphatase PrpC